MEIQEKDHIKNNILYLSKVTTCNDTFLTILRAGGVLLADEVKRLTKENVPSMKRSMELYNILFTRTNSYKYLLKALKGTDQKGAYKILRNCEPNLHTYKNIVLDRNNVLGAGNHGTKVFGGTFGERASKIHVAVKVYNKRSVDAALPHREIRILTKLEAHPNVVQYHAIEIDNDITYIILERCYVTLDDELNTGILKMNDENILRKCTKGLNYLHRQNIVHGDLKPSNIFITNKKKVKIADFGLSKAMITGQSSAFESSKEWMAPEILNYLNMRGISQAPKMNAQTDVFALGCIYYYTLSEGVHPFGMDGDIVTNIKQNKSTLLFTRDGKDKKWASIIIKMLAPKPTNRPNMGDVLTHIVFITKYNDEPEKFTIRRRIDTSSRRQREEGKLRMPIPEKFKSAASPKKLNTEIKYVDPANRNREKKWLSDKSWQKFTFHWESEMLAQTTMFTAEFVKKLGDSGVLTYFSFNLTRQIIKTQQWEDFFRIPFSKSDYYECIKRALRETDQTDTLDVLLECESKNKKWSTRTETLSPYSSFNLLSEAIGYNCNIALLREFSDSNRDIAPFLQTNDLGTSLLHIAVGCGNIDVIQDLIQAGIDVNSMNNNYQTPLHFLGNYASNIVDVTEVLLENGVNMSATDMDSNSVAHTVCLYVTPQEYYGWVELMLQKGHHSLWRMKDANGDTPVHTAVFNSEVAEGTLSLIASEMRFDFNSKNDKGNTVLMLAVLGGQRRSLLKRIVDLGGDWSLKDKQGSTALHYAVESGNLEAVQYLLSIGAEPNVRDKDSWTPIHHLHLSDLYYIEITSVLLKHKADLFAKTRHGNTVAHLFGRKKGSKSDYLAWKKFMRNNGYASLFELTNSKQELPA